MKHFSVLIGFCSNLLSTDPTFFDTSGRSFSRNARPANNKKRPAFTAMSDVYTKKRSGNETEVRLKAKIAENTITKMP